MKEICNETLHKKKLNDEECHGFPTEIESDLKSELTVSNKKYYFIGRRQQQKELKRNSVIKLRFLLKMC